MVLLALLLGLAWAWQPCAASHGATHTTTFVMPRAASKARDKSWSGVVAYVSFEEPLVSKRTLGNGQSYTDPANGAANHELPNVAGLNPVTHRRCTTGVSELGALRPPVPHAEVASPPRDGSARACSWRSLCPPRRLSVVAHRLSHVLRDHQRALLRPLRHR